jgi:hypothetical protein
MPRMKRPTRQRNHLVEKVALKQSRTTAKNRKPGKRAKRWRKWIESYKAVAE